MHVPKDPTRVALVVVDAFAALTAIGGGAMLVAGLEDGRFPASWLTGTPLSGYVIPGLILAGAVGGSAAIAAVATLRGGHRGGLASMLSGVVLLGWIVGEIVILSGRRAEMVSAMEGFYLAVGLVMAGLGFSASRPSPARPRQASPRRD